MNTLPDRQERQLMGVRYDVVDRQRLFQQLRWAGAHGTGGNIMNVNIHAMNLAYEDASFRTVLQGADMVFVDGMGVKLGIQLAGQEVGDRMTPADWLEALFVICGEQQWPIFLLGDVDEMGARFEQAMAERYPQVPFVGRHHGFFDRDGAENDRVVELINASGAQVLLVGMSMPIQEKWIWQNRDRLKPAIRLATGAFHRVFTGDIARGPKWMTDNGLEWLYRLCMQPHTWKRYLIGNPLFFWRVIWHHRIKRSRRRCAG